MAQKQELKAFIGTRNTTCGECGQELYKGSLFTLEEKAGALCLSCADLDHLVLLFAGNAALTRRAKQNSKLHAVVLKWARARQRYERQGILVEEEALAQAEESCLADADARERRRQRDAERRETLDQAFVRDFASAVRRDFPNAPKGREQAIAEHACLKHSGRVGRSAAAKEFDPEMTKLAVAAHIRHQETGYDTLLLKGYDRYEARRLVQDRVTRLLQDWQGTL